MSQRVARLLIISFALSVSSASFAAPKKAAKKAPADSTAKVAGKQAKPGKRSVAADSKKGAGDPGKGAKPASNSNVQDLNGRQGTDTVAAQPLGEETRSIELGDVRHYKSKLNTALGIDIVSGLGSAFHVGGQFGFAVWEGVPFYVGPDLGFSLFSPGSIIDTSVSAWYELRIYGAPRLSMSLGAGLGPGITFSTSQFNSLILQAYLDGCIVQQINELASVRGQFRPAMVGGYFGFNVNLNVQFRFQ